MIVVRHIVRRAGRADEAEYIHGGPARNVRIVSRPDANGAAPIRRIVRLRIRPGVIFLFPRGICRSRITRRKRRTVRDIHARIRRGRGFISDAGHRDKERSAVNVVIFFGNNLARRFHRDGFFIVRRQALLCLFVRQRRIGGHHDLPQIHARIVRDVRLGIDTGPAHKRGPDAERRPAVFRISFRFIVRGNRSLPLRGNDGAVAHFDVGIGRDVHPQLTARAGCHPRAHRIHADVFAVFMIGGNRHRLSIELRALSDIDARLLIQRHGRERDRTGHDAARTGNGIRI